MKSHIPLKLSYFTYSLLLCVLLMHDFYCCILKFDGSFFLFFDSSNLFLGTYIVFFFFAIVFFPLLILPLYMCQVTSVMSDSVTLWTVVHQSHLSMGFSSQEHWNGLPCPPPGDLPDPGIELWVFLIISISFLIFFI